MPDSQPFAEHARDYKAKGWSVFPLPAREKHPPPSGYTGRSAGDTTATVEELDTWARTQPGGNIGIRLMEEVGIDVDAYEGKPGAQTLAEWEGEAGKLPPTWRVTSRFDTDKVSGIRLYRLPPGVSTDKWTGGFGGIELIRKEHRYFVAPGSIHPKTGLAYQAVWEATGETFETMPGIHQIPYLPDKWCEFLSEVKAPRHLRVVAGADGEEEIVSAEPMCRAISDELTHAIAIISAGKSARHDEVNKAVLRIGRLAEKGHKGIEVAYKALKSVFVIAVQDRATYEEATAEFRRAVEGAATIITGDPTPDDEKGCFCLLSGYAEGLIPATVEHSETGMTITEELTSRAPTELPDELRRAIGREALILKARQEATRIVREEAEGIWSLPPSRVSLADELDVEDPPIDWSVDQLHERGTNVLLTAAYKTGKTTLSLNLMRSLMDGTPFLGHFDCSKGLAQGERVAWWNFELTERQARRWLREMDVKNLDRGSVLHMRGYKLPIHSEHAVEELARWLVERNVKYLIVDPYGSAYDGKENDNDEVREWTRRLDEVKRLAGVESVVLVSHTGRGGQDKGFEHARGAAKLDDWADIRWVYTRDREDEENPLRYFYAHGRDVDFEEKGVSYDDATRTLVLENAAPPRGSKGPSNKTIMKVIETIMTEPGLNRTEIISRVGGKKQTAEKAFKRAESLGLIVWEKGSKPNEKLWSPTPGLVWATVEKAVETSGGGDVD